MSIIKSCFKLFVILIIISLVSCEAEEDYIKSRPFDKKTNQVRVLTGNEAAQISNLLTQKVKKLTNLKVDSESTMSMRTSEGIIDFNNILQVIDTLGINNYTFKIINHPDDDIKTFHNLVLTEKENQFEVTVLKYDMTNQFATDYYNLVKSIGEFEGTLTAKSLNIVADPCHQVVVPSDPGAGGGGGSENPGDGSNNPPDSGSSGGGGSSGCKELIISYECSCGRSFGNFQAANNCAGNSGNYYVVAVLNIVSVSSCRTGDDPCNPDGSIGVLPPENFYLPIKIEEVQDFLENNPFGLTDVPCSQIQYWQTIAQHQVPQSVKDKVNAIDAQTGWFTSAGIQTLNDSGNGAVVNMDFFPVTINEMPKKPNGEFYTQKELFDYIRTHINDFFDDLTFTPVVNSSYNINDSSLWLSNNPLNSILSINIIGNEGSVACSKYNQVTGEWYFTTINAPWDGTHPVSGNRAFGYYTDINGKMVIYTRGVDRLTDGTYMYGPNGVIAEALQQEVAFNQADSKWSNFQSNIRDFVNTGKSSNNNGQSFINTPEKYRPNWNKVKDVLSGKRPISDLGCN